MIWISPSTIELLPWKKEKDWPSRRLIVVKQYQRPNQTPGGIVIPDAFKEDRYPNYWEVIYAEFGACRAANYTLTPGDIVKCRWSRLPTYVALDPADNQPWYLLDAENVWGIIPNTWKEVHDE